MFRRIRAVSNEYPFLEFLVIGFQPLFVWDVAEGEAPKYTNVFEVLTTAGPRFFGDRLSVALTPSWKSVIKKICRFHCFDLETIWKAAVD